MRNYFDKEMDLMKLDVIKICACSQEALGLLNLAAVQDAESQCEPAAALYNEVKIYQSNIETRCVKLLILRQPVASDLRRIKAAMSMIVDVARIAEQTWHCCELQLNFGTYKKPQAMLEAVKNMTKSACDAYINKDLESAKQVVEDDDIVDALFSEIKKDLAAALKAGRRGDDWVLDCLLASKYFERIGDHAVKIAQLVKDVI